MQNITLKNGHVLGLTIADFGPANRLRKEMVRELRTVRVDTDIDLQALQKNPGKLFEMELDAKTLNTVKDLVCQLLGSDAVEAAALECMKKCTLQGEKITLGSFEKEETREDFLVVAWEVIKTNVGPFFAGLDLKSLGSVVGQKSAPQ